MSACNQLDPYLLEREDGIPVINNPPLVEEAIAFMAEIGVTDYSISDFELNLPKSKVDFKMPNRELNLWCEKPIIDWLVYLQEQTHGI